MYATLMKSDIVHPYGRAKGGTSPVGVEMCTKPNDLSPSESEGCGHGEGSYPSYQQM